MPAGETAPSTCDRYVRALCTNGGIRVLACSTTELTRSACSLQQASATASIALGRGLAAGVLMGALLKQGQRVALKFEGNGPLVKLLIEADSDGAVRGSLGNPAAEAEPVDGRWNVPGILGKAGFLTVTRDLGVGGEPYRGMVQLRTSEIGDDLAYYLTDSEQVPSAVGLSVQLARDGQVQTAGGFLIQALPGADGSEIDAILGRIATLGPIAEVLREEGAEGLIRSIFDATPYTLLESRDVFFRCSCSRMRVEQALLSLGGEQLRDMCDKEQGAQVTCEFCRQDYTFDANELTEMISSLSAG